MALNYVTSYDYSSVVGDREVKFKQWSAKDERKYLQLIEKSQDGVVVNEKDIYDTLIVPCIEDKKIILSTAEQKKLLIDIRSESISEYLEEEHTCAKCGAISNIKVKLSDIMTYNKSSYSPVTIGKYVFNLGPIKTIEERSKLNINNGIVDYVFDDFILHIHSIQIDGVLEDKFNQKELMKFMDKLPTKIFDKLFEEYQKMIDSVEIAHSFVCEKCKDLEIIKYDQIPNLLWA